MHDITIPQFIVSEQDYICELCEGKHGFNHMCQINDDSGREVI